MSEGATNRLKQLKGRTGLTPNYICRVALCTSLNDPRPPSLEEHDNDGQEFNRYTLTGDYDDILVALVKERLVEDGLDPEEDLFDYFQAHLNRGVFQVFNKVKSPADFAELIPQGARGGGADDE